MTVADPRQSPVIVKAIIHDSRLYQMEYKDNKNTLLLVLLQLYSKEIPESQLSKVYSSIVKTMEPLLMPKVTKLSVPLHVDNWQDYFGDTDIYSSYLEFFDRQMVIRGVQDTLENYFYNSPMAQSIGSQRTPIIHLALGVQHGLPEVVGQALSYMAAFYQDTSFLFEEPRELCDGGYLTAREILIEQVKVDPRFRSFPETPYLGYGQPKESKLTYHKILKSSKELLRTYVYLWKVPKDMDEALNELRILTAHLIMFEVKQQKGVKSDGSLLGTLNALDILYPNNTCPIHLVRIQFLNIILSYIVQDRPDMPLYSNNDQKKRTNSIQSTLLYKKLLEKELCESSIKTISAISALEEAQDKTDKSSIFNKIMQHV